MVIDGELRLTIANTAFDRIAGGYTCLLWLPSAMGSLSVQFSRNDDVAGESSIGAILTRFRRQALRIGTCGWLPVGLPVPATTLIRFLVLEGYGQYSARGQIGRVNEELIIKY